MVLRSFPSTEGNDRPSLRLRSRLDRNPWVSHPRRTRRYDSRYGERGEDRLFLALFRFLFIHASDTFEKRVVLAIHDPHARRVDVVVVVVVEDDGPDDASDVLDVLLYRT